jgi:ABC-type multidrug transport system ATPase subunit
LISVLQEPPGRESSLPDKLFVGEALDLYSSFYTDPADWWPLVKTRGLDSKKHEMFKKLSGGQKQRLSVALALVGNPRFAVRDELTTGLDPEAAGTPGISSRGQGSSLWTRRRRWRRASTPG